MRLKDYIYYFQQIAQNNKELSHDNPSGRCAFKRLDIEDIINSLKLNEENILMFLENPEIKPVDAYSDNIRKIISGAFLIIQPVEKGNFDDEIEALDNTLDVCEQVVSKILNDVKNYKQNRSYDFAIKGIDLNTININKVGPLFGNWYGYRATFAINQTFSNNLVLDEDKWRNEKKFSI